MCVCVFLGDMKEEKKLDTSLDGRDANTHTLTLTLIPNDGTLFLLIQFVRLVGLTAQSIYR